MDLLIQFNSFQNNQITKFLFLIISLIFISSCAPSKRFTEYKETISRNYKNEVRVLLNDSSNQLNLGNDVYLISEGEKLALIKEGNKIIVEAINQDLFVQLGSKNIHKKEFFIEPASDSLIILNNKKYRGRIKLVNGDGTLKIINQISLEDYIKGVMTKEMPVGKNLEHYEALKAFAIAARTYAINKIFKSTTFYDVLPDVRDQVYGGADAEHPLSNKAVDETKGLILTYKNDAAIVFYHSTCGGYTESSKNVFTEDEVEYLKSVKDGEPAYCSISPNFLWEEVLTEKAIIKRLADAKLIDSEVYSIENIIIKSRFPSGRINELEIVLKNNDELKSISLFGNSIRSIIKNQTGNGILKSNNFTIELTADRTVKIFGKGSGHGVGLCQWGAIAQSKQGKSYEEILYHYFPGTQIKNLND